MSSARSTSKRRVQCPLPRSGLAAALYLHHHDEPRDDGPDATAAIQTSTYQRSTGLRENALPHTTRTYSFGRGQGGALRMQLEDLGYAVRLTLVPVVKFCRPGWRPGGGSSRRATFVFRCLGKAPRPLAFDQAAPNSAL